MQDQISKICGCTCASSFPLCLIYYSPHTAPLFGDFDIVKNRSCKQFRGATGHLEGFKGRPSIIMTFKALESRTAGASSYSSIISPAHVFKLGNAHSCKIIQKGTIFVRSASEYSHASVHLGGQKAT